MSRVDHVVSRRRGDERKARVIFDRAGRGRRRARVNVERDPKTLKVLRVEPVTTAERHKTTNKGRYRRGSTVSWWAEKFADVVERRRRGDEPAKKVTPQTLRRKVGRLALLDRARWAARNTDRPRGVSRQLHRLMHRVISKVAQDAAREGEGTVAKNE